MSSLSFVGSVKDQTLLQRCNFPATCVLREQVPLKNECRVFSRIPERTGTGALTYLHETGTGENGDYARNDLDISHLISILKFCGGEGCLKFGRTYHRLIAKTGLNGDEFVNTSLIDMYAKCGDIDSAVNEAFSLFMNYESWDNKPNSYTYSSVLAICGILSTIEEGKQLHAQVVKMQYLSETAVSNALLTMYCKCEAMASAESLFERLP